MELVIEFIISKFIEGSTCFERHTAHHEEMIHFPLSLDNGRSPHGYINQTKHIQFRAPDDGRCSAGNM
jgi:hypothetical protein